MNKRQLEKRKAEMTARAKAELAKTEIVQFRLDRKSIMILFKLTEKYRKPLGAMVREWVLERMQQETQRGANPRTIEQRLSALERQIAKKA